MEVSGRRTCRRPSQTASARPTMQRVRAVVLAPAVVAVAAGVVEAALWAVAAGDPAAVVV